MLIDVNQTRYDELIRKEEQLRILKNFIKKDGVLHVDIDRLIEAMEEKASE